MGETGVGKSTYANALLGDISCHSCTFKVCNSLNLCTKNTTFAVGKWLGNGSRFTVIDTPGFSYNDEEESHRINEMLDVLKSDVKGVNVIVLLIKGNTHSLSNGMRTMMKILEATFSKNIWMNMVIGVNMDWSYKEKDIKQRDKSGRYEHQYLQEWNDRLIDSTLIEQDIPGVFTDPWSQQQWNLDDQNQQEYWKTETDKLWRFSQQNDLFMFKTVKDLLLETTKLKQDFILENAMLKRKKREITEQNDSLKDVIANLVKYTNNTSHLMEGINELKRELVSHINR